MKTVCKKLLCLMLVAMMLVSAVPAAFAAESDVVCNQCGNPATFHPGGAREDATCTDGGKDCYKCVNEECIPEGKTAYYFLVETAPLGHTWDNGVVDKAATCTETGVKTFTCDTCNATKTEAITAGGHSYTSEITTAATCTEDGVKTFTCGCGDSYTEAVAKLGHNIVNYACTRCDYAEDPIGSITFHYMTSANVWTEKTVYVYENNQEIAPPTVSSVRGFYFQGWSSVSNGAVDLSAGSKIVWNSGTSSDYWATYDDDADDGLVHVTVKVAYYVNGKWHNNETLLTSPDFNKNEDDNQMFRWLYNDGFDQINNALFADGSNVDYKWNKVFYLNYKGTDKVDSEMMDDGNKTVYVVLNSKDYIEANVQLYVHKSASSTVYDIIDMDGYTAGDVVTRSDVKEVLEDKNYSYTSLSYLYSQTEWENLLNGDNTDPDSEVTVATNGTTKIHVIAKNAYTSSSTADSSNPKTGDSIMIAVATMALAAAALVSMVELKKRKMI